MNLNKSLKVLFLYNGIFAFAYGLFTPLYALYVEEIGQKLFAVSISWAALLVSTTVCTFFVAKFGDKIKKRGYLLVTSFLIRTFVWVLFIFANSLVSLVVLQILAGVCEGLGTPAFNAIFAEHLDKNRHVSEYSDWSLVSNLVVAVSTLLGGIIVMNFGFNILFIIMSLLTFVCFLGSYANVDRI